MIEGMEVLMLRSSRRPEQETQAIMEYLWDQIGLVEAELARVRLPLQVEVRRASDPYQFWLFGGDAGSFISESLAQLLYHVRYLLGQEEWDQERDQDYFRASEAKGESDG